MQIDLLSAAIGGILFWLLGWVAKHLLDRLVLPTAIDWWARLNKQRSMNRANLLLKQFQLERIQSLDARHLTLVMGKRIAYLLCAVGIFISLLILINIRQTIIQESHRMDVTSVYYLLLVPLYFTFLLAQAYYWNLRLTSIFTDPTEHRERTVVRITRLLAAAGLGEEEIKVWLERVQPIQAP